MLWCSPTPRNFFRMRFLSARSRSHPPGRAEQHLLKSIGSPHVFFGPGLVSG